MWEILVFLFLLFFLFILLATKLPIAFSLGAVSIVGFILFTSSKDLMHIALTVYTHGMSPTLIVVPLFVLMAEVINFSGFAGNIYDALYKWMNRVPGSLASCTIASAAMFSAICGSSVATAATIGLISIPQMLKRGYSKKLACGVTGVGGGLGILIPPSLGFIIYGSITETSIARLFMAGILPGIFLAALLICVITGVSILKPSIAPAAQEDVTWKQRYQALLSILPIVGLIFLVLGSIYLGIATVEEAAGVGALGALLVATVYRKMNWNKLQAALLNSVRVTGMVFFIVFGGMVFAYLLTSLGVPQEMSKYVCGLSVNRWTVMTAIILLYIMLGCIFEGIAMVIITMPFIFPIVLGLGFDPIWFGVIIILVTEIGLLTPPVGMTLFVLRGIAPKEITWSDIIMGCLPFTMVLLLGVMVLMIFPEIALFIPSRMK